MNHVTVTVSSSKSEQKQSSPFDRRTLVESLLLFAGTAVLLSLLIHRIVDVYDEGILLTGSMQTMAGQVLHRDFNYDYGPLQLYLLAGLFKLFGPSVLVERLASVFSGSCLVATLYLLARRFCDRAVAVSAAVLCMLWVVGMAAMTRSLMNPALCVLTLWGAWLILPVSEERVQRRRALGAGSLAAIIFLFRYDTGLGTVAASLTAVAIIWLQEPRSRMSLRRLVVTVIGPYLTAFAMIVTPAAIAYLSVAPLHDFLYDIFIYMGKYYSFGRRLPFPVPTLGPTFAESAIYLLPVTIALGFWVAARSVIPRMKHATARSADPIPEWANFLLALSVSAAMLCVKGLVRVSLGAVCLGIIVCVLIGALLFQHRAVLNLWLRRLLAITLTLFVLTAAGAAKGNVLFGQLPGSIHLQPLAINRILTPNRQPPGPAFRSWCADSSALTRGFCFLLDENHIRTIRYLETHTGTRDYLYVGLDHHDRIVVNDMITYFAVQRLPATRWTEFNPFLENRADVQQEMIAGLELHKPPYIVLDSEFDNIWEPNGSSISTGVHLLDDYISAHYKTVQQYGKLAILQRQG